MTTKTYAVHRGMHGDGRNYEPGDTRELDEVDARDLLESGAISLVGEEPNVRNPAVTHSFGKAEPTGHIGTTTATTDETMIALADAEAVRAGKSKASPKSV